MENYQKLEKIGEGEHIRALLSPSPAGLSRLTD